MTESLHLHRMNQSLRITLFLFLPHQDLLLLLQTERSLFRLHSNLLPLQCPLQNLHPEQNPLPPQEGEFAWEQQLDQTHWASSLGTLHPVHLLLAVHLLQSRSNQYLHRTSPHPPTRHCPESDQASHHQRH